MYCLRKSNVKVSAASISILLAFSLTFSSFSYSHGEQNTNDNTLSVNVSVNQGIKSFAIPHSKSSITIDGELSDQAWQQALTIPLNIVNDPWNNLPSPVKTTAKIIENGEYLYVSFIADDPHPENIIGFLGDRDTKWGDDLVGLKLDTFNSRRLNYTFLVNPFGVQNDSIQNEVTGDNNYLWDGIWQSYGKITKQGYQVEIAIPFNSLNFVQGKQEKTWAIELVRLYPRNERLRISHMPIDRNNACWICQMPEITGFKEAEIGQNITLTPFAVASRNDTRDIYSNNDSYNKNNKTDTGIDLRWGITPSTLLNTTINPDFSTVESDAGQLNVNTAFSLFYDEKRTFFLENSDYFASNYNLVYTRNIADPDFGVKLTSREKNHSYGVFLTNDKETNFIMPSSTQSRLISLNEKSYSGAANYRYNVNDNLSFGIIGTLRKSNSYHNYVTGIDSKYRFNDSNLALVQLLTSETQQDNLTTKNNNDSFTDQAIKIDLKHNSEFWQANAGYQKIGKNFRADLGFMPRADFEKKSLSVSRIVYADNNDNWQEVHFSGRWYTQDNENGELLERDSAIAVLFYGSMLSTIDVSYHISNKVGLRQDRNNTSIKNNAHLFNENYLDFYADFQPSNRIFVNVIARLGDKIDFGNNRLGTITELSPGFSINLTNHLEVGINQTYSKLDSEGKNVYIANLTDVRISYQFDVQSYLKLSMVYSDVNRNPNNNPNTFYGKRDRSLSTQLIYSYKVNPQTVFFLGYSDSSYQDDDLSTLKRDQRTFFSKISYAWIP
ncbi:MAG: carbohydrate binding family 9 domain-containing protein [Alteromonadaceae bacterium]|nr:carbohydrate binding family 9 domain-containing protein [Alteromonadaceae bacterium]